MESKFNGKLLPMIGHSLLSAFIVIITLTIGTPWAICRMQRWVINNTVIDGKQLTFDGKGIQLFGRCILWLFLTVITVGIFGLWVPIRMQNWITKHTHVKAAESKELVPAR